MCFFGTEKRGYSSLTPKVIEHKGLESGWWKESWVCCGVYVVHLVETYSFLKLTILSILLVLRQILWACRWEVENRCSQTTWVEGAVTCKFLPPLTGHRAKTKLEFGMYPQSMQTEWTHVRTVRAWQSVRLD